MHCRGKDCLESEICVYVDRKIFNIVGSLERLAFSVIQSDLCGIYIRFEITDASALALCSFLGKSGALNIRGMRSGTQ